MKKLALICGTAALALALSGCTGATDSAGSSTPSPVGTWGVSNTEGQPYLELTDDGAVAGSDGCNRLVGTWEAGDAAIEFSPLASTMMACEGVETWLGGATGAVISGNTMTVTDASDKVIGTLEQN